MNKREFVKTLGGASLGLVFRPSVLSRYMAMPHAELAQDEAFWGTIRGKYKLTPEYINLENGYYSMQAEPVLEAFIGHVRSINVQASHYMRTRQPDDKLRVRTRLAKMAGVRPEELIITRNTTESLDTVISGYDWKPGDEAVMAAQDYGAMLDMFKLQARRHGIVNRVVSLPLDPQSDDELVQLYAARASSACNRHEPLDRHLRLESSTQPASTLSRVSGTRTSTSRIWERARCRSSWRTASPRCAMRGRDSMRSASGDVRFPPGSWSAR